MFSCDFCEFFKNTVSYRTPPTAASTQAASNIGHTKPNAKPRKSNKITSYIHITIPYGSYATYQKFKSLSAACLSTTTISSIQSMLNSLQNGRYSFTFTTLLVHTTNGTIPTKNPYLYFSQFLHPHSTFTNSQNHLYNPH